MGAIGELDASAVWWRMNRTRKVHLLYRAGETTQSCEELSVTKNFGELPSMVRLRLGQLDWMAICFRNGWL